MKKDTHKWIKCGYFVFHKVEFFGFLSHSLQKSNDDWFYIFGMGTMNGVDKVYVSNNAKF